MFELLGTVVGLVALTMVATWRLALWNLVSRHNSRIRSTVAWVDLGKTPLAEKGYTPQGMTYAEDCLIFANTWKNKQSRVYRINPESMEITATFDMPEEAVHTSGLAFDGKHLWAVDHISKTCYKLDVDKSFTSGNAEILGTFDTGLKGVSACCFLEYKGERLLAVSDFMHTRRTYLVKHIDALKAGRMRGNVLFSYRNEGFSQGLVWDGEHLYESENKLGTNVINRMEVDLLHNTKSARKATVRQFNAPSRGVEDLAYNRGIFYTSDEATFRFYRGQLD